MPIDFGCLCSLSLKVFTFCQDGEIYIDQIDGKYFRQDLVQSARIIESKTFKALMNYGAIKPSHIMQAQLSKSIDMQSCRDNLKMITQRYLSFAFVTIRTSAASE